MPTKPRLTYTGRTKRLVVFKKQKMGKRPRKAKLFRAPKAGGRSLMIPIKVGYTYDKIGTGAAYLNFDDDVGLHKAPADFITRYNPIFDYIRINKVRIEITCPYNIGQAGVGTGPSLFRCWSKRGFSTAETPPTDVSDWLNLQTAKRTNFSGRTNSLSYYYTPGYETTVQPLNVAVTSLRVLYKQWQTLQNTRDKMPPHIGIIAQVVRMDGGNVENSHVFKVNVTLYCQMKSIKQL